MGKSQKLDTLTQDPRNANKGTARGRKALAASLRDLGTGRSILVDKHGVIIAGNKTSEQAALAGITSVRIIETDGKELIAVKRTDLDLSTDDVAKRLAIADNRVAELDLKWDSTQMLAYSTELPLGDMWTPKELGALLADVRTTSTATDDAPPPPTIAKTVLGDLYQLGRHRLLCGDAKLSDSYLKLLQGSPVDAIWTDPPYGVNYFGKTAEALQIQSDDLGDQFPAFLRSVFAHCFSSLKAGATIYVAHAHLYGNVFQNQFLASGLELKQMLVWVKDQFVMGRGDYQWQHEAILYGWKPGAAHSWYSDRKQTTVLNFDRPKRSVVYPTMKPVALVEYCIRNSTEPHASVLDPFGGSGTTLIACQASDRVCYSMELDPKYCDVIVQRWEEATGQKAVLLTAEA